MYFSCYLLLGFSTTHTYVIMKWIWYEYLRPTAIRQQWDPIIVNAPLWDFIAAVFTSKVVLFTFGILLSRWLSYASIKSMECFISWIMTNRRTEKKNIANTCLGWSSVLIKLFKIQTTSKFFLLLTHAIKKWLDYNKTNTPFSIKLWMLNEEIYVLTNPVKFLRFIFSGLSFFSFLFYWGPLILHQHNNLSPVHKYATVILNFILFE